jgi:hypothetical protein
MSVAKNVSWMVLKVGVLLGLGLSHTQTIPALTMMAVAH